MVEPTSYNFDTPEYDGWFDRSNNRYYLRNKKNEKTASFRKDLFERKLNKLMKRYLNDEGDGWVSGIDVERCIILIAYQTKRLHGNL